MKEIKMSVPEDILYALDETKSDFIHHMKLYTAMEFYRSGKLSMGKAAELAEMSIAAFMFELGRHDIAVIDYEEDDFKAEVERILTSR